MVSVYSATNGYATTTSLNKNSQTQSKALGQTASGKGITKASDNAAGLAVALQLSSDVSTLRQSSTNLLQGTSVLQTADGALEQTGNILNRMKELATQANSGGVDDAGRTAINEEYQSLAQELGNLATQTSFNGQPLLNGSYNQDFQVGTTGTDVLSADLSSVDISLSGLGLTAGAGASAGALLTQSSAAATSSELDTAIANISSYRADVGATLSEFSTQSDVVDETITATIEAQSAITDADIGKASSDLAGSKLLTELSVAAAAQGNKMSASFLKLVR
ncbi:MAG: flagellin [Pseudobdellovibrionaceae bacterium]